MLSTAARLNILRTAYPRTSDQTVQSATVIVAFEALPSGDQDSTAQVISQLPRLPVVVPVRTS